jgi:arylsulfatase A-like enzyme
MVKRSDDLDLLGQLESNVELWLNKGQRYMVVYAPQLSHSPFLDITPDGRLKNVTDRVRPLLALQDAYLGEILKLLVTHHRLDKTLIIVVGDHGLRNRDEDPNLPLGMLDDISFHVPMLVYAPQILKASVTIPWLTSHIDISPTVLDLIGIDRQRDLEQGAPIWDPALQSRTTFLFARHLFSADGYYANGRFAMSNEFSARVFVNSRLHFDAANAVPPNSPDYHQVTSTVQQMVNLQQRWVEVFGRDNRP